MRRNINWHLWKSHWGGPVTNLLLSFNSNILMAKTDLSVTLLVLLMQEKTVFGAVFLGALLFFWGSQNFWVQFHHKIYRRHFHRILLRKYWYSISFLPAPNHIFQPLCVLYFLCYFHSSRYFVKYQWGTCWFSCIQYVQKGSYETGTNT